MKKWKVTYSCNPWEYYDLIVHANSVEKVNISVNGMEIDHLIKADNVIIELEETVCHIIQISEETE